MRFHCSCVAILVACAFQAGVSAQSLADVARAEEARRKTVMAGSKVYTNDDLGRTPGTSPAPSPPVPTGTAATLGGSLAKPGEDKAVDPAKTETYWNERATTIQQSLSRSKVVLDALQSQVNGLNAEFLNTDDPGQRTLVEARFHRANGELQHVQQDIERQTGAAFDLQEEARRAGVPAGWVR